MTVLRCSFDDEAAADAVAGALEGPGRPAGITRVERAGTTLAIHLDAARTSPALVAAIVDAETSGRRAIAAPNRPADDRELTALGSALLSEPDLDTSRLIETYVEPMLGMR